MKRKLSDWAGNIVALAIVIVTNALANVLQYGGNTTAAVSDKYHSLFTPAGFTFSIWSLIYALLVAFVIYQALPAQRGNESLARISGWFKLGCAANALWMFTWHFEWIMVALLLMIVLLVSLVAIYRILGIVEPGVSGGERWLVQLPFSVYLAWISVALIANMSAMQTALGWNDLGLEEVSWTLIKLSAAGVIAAIVTLRRNDVAFGLVIAWAAFGIGAGQAATLSVASAAFTICLLAFALAAYEMLRIVTSR